MWRYLGADLLDRKLTAILKSKNFSFDSKKNAHTYFIEICGLRYSGSIIEVYRANAIGKNRNEVVDRFGCDFVCHVPFMLLQKKRTQNMFLVIELNRILEEYLKNQLKHANEYGFFLNCSLYWKRSSKNSWLTRWSFFSSSFSFSNMFPINIAIGKNSLNRF